MKIFATVLRVRAADTLYGVPFSIFKKKKSQKHTNIKGLIFNLFHWVAKGLPKFNLFHWIATVLSNPMHYSNAKIPPCLSSLLSRFPIFLPPLFFFFFTALPSSSPPLSRVDETHNLRRRYKQITKQTNF